MATDLTEIGIKVSVDGAEETADKLDKVEKAGTKTEGSLKGIAKSANKTNGPFRAMRGSMQQISWQLQDVAVQSQMGTDKLMILGQQGPQIASIFGPGGAVIGAMIAFGAILGGLVYKSLTGTSEELKVLEEQAKKNAEAFDDLTAAQKRVVVMETTKRIENQSKILKELNAELKEATELGPRITTDMLPGEARTGSGEAIITTESEQEFADRLSAIQAKADDATAVIKLYRSGIDDLRTDTEKLVDKLIEQERVTGKTNKQIIMSTDAYTKATPKQKEQILLLNQQIENAKLADAQKKKSKAEDQKALEQKQAFIKKLDEQHQLMTLTGQDLYEYQAIQAGATGEDIKSVAAKIELIATTKAQIKADAELVKAKAKIASDGLKRGDQAQNLMQEIEQANMTELQQLEAQLTAKGGLLLEFLQEDHITLDQYLAMDAELQATYDAAELLANKEKNDKLLDSDKAYADAKASLDQQVASSASALVGDLANAAEEGSGAQKALFAIQKAIAIATAIVNTELAAATALAPPPLGLAPIAGAGYAQAIRAMGYASVGIMAGTAIAGGRALGGQVRGGESYLVGERGPELLTMGTSGRVTSNDSLKNAITNNSGSDVVINQSINITTGVQSTVRAEIITLMPQIAQAAKGAVADARLRGGNFSKAMSGA
jgi:hypothetical protein